MTALDQFIEGMWQVLTLANVLTAVAGGTLVGWFLIGRAAADPAWISPVATAKGVAILVAVYSIAIGCVFFMGQAIAAYVDGDPFWPRIVSRWFVMVLFDASMSIAIYFRVSYHIEIKHRNALSKAKSQVSRPSIEAGKEE